MKQVPTYRLYGDDSEAFEDMWLHCEPIRSRSARYGWEIELHRHNEFLQRLYVSAGSAEVSIKDRRIDPETPFVIIVPPRAVHGFRFTRNVEGYVLTMSFDRVGRILDACAGARQLMTEPYHLELGGTDDRAACVIDRYVKLIAGEFAGSAAWRHQLIEATLLALLVHLSREFLISRGVELSGNQVISRKALAFRMLVDKEYRQHRRVGFYARKLAISATHLNRISRAELGDSALGVVNRRLITEATRDLTFSRLSVKQIAHSLGFDDAAYFSRFFSAHVGQAPTEFRRSQISRFGSSSKSERLGR